MKGITVEETATPLSRGGDTFSAKGTARIDSILIIHELAKRTSGHDLGLERVFFTDNSIIPVDVEEGADEAAIAMHRSGGCTNNFAKVEGFALSREAEESEHNKLVDFHGVMN